MTGHRAPSLLLGTTWEARAACRDVDPELFFPTRDKDAPPSAPGTATRAKLVCATCQVREQCAEYALRTRQSFGVWGGMTAEERHPRTGAHR